MCKREQYENSRYRVEKVITDKPNRHFVRYLDKFFRGTLVKDQLTEKEADEFVKALMEES